MLLLAGDVNVLYICRTNELVVTCEASAHVKPQH